MRQTISLVALCFLAVSCKKKNPTTVENCEPTFAYNHSNDTIFPSDYLMAYPGSWWEYDTGLIDSCTSWEAVPIRNVTHLNGCTYVQEDRKILPKGMFYAEFLAGDKRVLNNGTLESTRYIPIYDTIIGVFYEQTFNSGSGINSYSDSYTIELLDRIDSIVIGSNTYYDVLHIKQLRHIYYPHAGGPPPQTQYYWFAKNVGMIKWIGENNGSSFPSGEMELVNHYIAPH